MVGRKEWGKRNEGEKKRKQGETMSTRVKKMGSSEVRKEEREERNGNRERDGEREKGGARRQGGLSAIGRDSRI